MSQVRSGSFGPKRLAKACMLASMGGSDRACQNMGFIIQSSGSSSYSPRAARPGDPCSKSPYRPKFPDSEARLNRLPLKYLREIIVDACVAGKPPTETGIEAVLRRHIAEQQAQTTCCGRCCGCTCGWA